MSPVDNAEGAGYWRSLAELARLVDGQEPIDPALVEGEFAKGAAQAPEGLSRRRFLQVMGASLALAGLNGCTRRVERIVPLSRNVPGVVAGQRQYFATAMELAGVAQPLLVTCQDGRPIKVEGNPDHPHSGGACSSQALASVLELYDPDRSQTAIQRDGGQEFQRTWNDFQSAARPLVAQMQAAAGNGVRVLSEATSSPTVQYLKGRFQRAFPRAQWHEYEPVSHDNEVAGSVAAFGTARRSHYFLDQARIIVCLDADLLGTHPDAIRLTRAFAQRRQPDQDWMSRLYVLESTLTLTGANADHRLPVRSEQIEPLLLALECAVRTRLALPVAQPQREAATAGFLGASKYARFVNAMADDLVAHRGAGLLAIGPQQPPRLQAIVHSLNGLLENAGRTVRYTDLSDSNGSHLESIRSLTSAMAAGQVQTLIILGGNPVYNAPVDLDFRARLSQVRTSIHLGLYRNETGKACTWHLPCAHYLEAWGDARAYDGSVTIIQPMIEPLHGGRSAIELLALLTNDELRNGYDLVRRTLREKIGNVAFDTRWHRTLHDGFVADSQQPFVIGPATRSAWLAPSAGQLRDEPETGLEIVFRPDNRVHDGRFSNSSWLQELPDPLTRLTWDNAILIAPKTAAALGVENGKMARLTYQQREMEAAVLVAPGQAAGSITVMLGQGRTAAGHVGGAVDAGVPPVGFDFYPLRASTSPDFGTGLAIQPINRSYRLATVQDQHTIDLVGLRERDHRVGELVREADQDYYRTHPDFARPATHSLPVVSLFTTPPTEGRKWGMAIDMTQCTGCNACVTACQAENNIPVVGKEQVLNGRIMQWIRVDRYFKGEPDEPQVAFQPVTCQQCENAPCEQVCPVAATVHSNEGLNDMVYNRCIGTRYCSNNCPYKVRRFNFLDYHQALEQPENEVAKLAFNPAVTVRSRGVMEKCTFCVQRIQAGKIRAGNEGRPLRDGEVQPACAQACPAKAITFGDLSDERSAVSVKQRDRRAYALLEELNVKPRVAYLARIRNPHPELAEAARDHANH